MKTTYQRMTWGLMALLLLAGCPPEDILGLNEEDSGTAVTVAVGQVIEVRLTSNASTGYAWALAALDTPPLEEAGHEFVAPESDLAGAPGVEVWRFVAAEAGQGILRLEYRRPWESEEIAAAAVFAVEITVVKGEA